MKKLKIVAWQKEIQKEVGIAKEAIADEYNCKEWETRLDSFLTPEMIKTVDVPDKIERNEQN